MKRSILILLSLFMVTSSCFALGVLTTGTTVGDNQLVIDGIYTSTGFIKSAASGSLAGIGARLFYGATKDIDIYGEYWMGSFVISDFDISQAANMLAVGLKYSFLKTAAKDPIDLAGFIELGSLTSKDLTWGMNTFGVTASKLIRRDLTLFGSTAITMNSSKIAGTGTKSVSETSTQFGFGAKYDVNSDFAVLGEITRFYLDSDIYQTISVGIEVKL